MILVIASMGTARIALEIPVCTENLNPNIMVMKAAKDGR
jgi:hypothetical protein